MKTIRALVLAVAGLLLAVSNAAAQPKGKPWTGHIGIGYTSFQGRASDHVDDSWVLTGGAVYRPPKWPLGLFMDVSYGDHEIDQDVLNLLDVDDGDIDNFTFAAGAHWTAPTKGSVGFYLKAGISEHFLDADLTNPGIISGIVCPPYWWWCFPVTGVGDVVVESESTWEFGYNAGIGMTFELANRSQLYLEARYNWIDLEQTVEYVPFIFGWRW